jgi:hypothetical protein
MHNEAMAQVKSPVYPEDDVAAHEKEQVVEAKTGIAEIVTSSGGSSDIRSTTGQTSLVPLRMKLISILLVTAVGFGSHWSSGVTGAMKSTLKKVSSRFGVCTKGQG